ncbi:MAG: hypothetical protein KAQ75_02875 [Bacteroidales bacterium]|nr:hypothetical protein [Bacteroidales bacterium]
MKNLIKNSIGVLFLALISVSLLMTNCEKDDEADAIVGTWILEKVEVLSVSYPASEFGISMTININDDNTFSGTTNLGEGTESDSGTWKRIDSETVEIYEGTDTSTLKKEGDYYTITETEDSITMKMYFKKQ